MNNTLPQQVRDLVPDPRIREMVKSCGNGRGVRPELSNDIIQFLRQYFRGLLPEPLTASRANVVSDVLAMKLYPASTVNAPDEVHGPWGSPWDERRLVRDWNWTEDKNVSRDPDWAADIGIIGLMWKMRDYDDDADVVRGAAYVLDRLDELRPRPTSPFDDQDPHRTM